MSSTASPPDRKTHSQAKRKKSPGRPAPKCIEYERRRPPPSGIYDDPRVAHCPSAYWAEIVLSRQNRSLYPPPIDRGPHFGPTNRCPTRRCRRQHRGRIVPAHYINLRGLCYDCQVELKEHRRRLFDAFELRASTPWGKLRQWLKEHGVDPALADLLGVYVEMLLLARATDLKRLHREIHRLSGEWLPKLSYRDADELLDQINLCLESYDGIDHALPADELPMAVVVAERLANKNARVQRARMLPEGTDALRAEIARFERTGKVRGEGTPRSAK
jgi:hypothetical protein